MKKILITIDDNFETILNNKFLFKETKKYHNCNKVLEYKKEMDDKINKSKELLKVYDYKGLEKLRDEMMLLDSYIDLFFILEQIQKIEDID